MEREIALAFCPNLQLYDVDATAVDFVDPGAPSTTPSFYFNFNF